MRTPPSPKKKTLDDFNQVDTLFPSSEAAGENKDPSILKR